MIANVSEWPWWLPRPGPFSRERKKKRAERRYTFSLTRDLQLRPAIAAPVAAALMLTEGASRPAKPSPIVVVDHYCARGLGVTFWACQRHVPAGNDRKCADGRSGNEAASYHG